MGNKRDMVSRSTYQKVVEENKRLKADLKKICHDDDPEYWNGGIDIMLKWNRHFEEQERKNQIMKEAAQNYIKENWDSFPEDFKRLLNKYPKND